jgi:hypothetical protein
MTDMEFEIQTCNEYTRLGMLSWAQSADSEGWLVRSRIAGDSRWSAWNLPQQINYHSRTKQDGRRYEYQRVQYTEEVVLRDTVESFVILQDVNKI